MRKLALSILTLTFISLGLMFASAEKLRHERDTLQHRLEILLASDTLLEMMEPTIVGDARSPEWPRVRLEHLKKHPTCAVCGNRIDVEVHHKISFAANPKLELDSENLITLCRKGKAGLPCHLFWGHGGNFQYYNPDVVNDTAEAAKIFKKRIKSNQE